MYHHASTCRKQATCSPIRDITVAVAAVTRRSTVGTSNDAAEDSYTCRFVVELTLPDHVHLLQSSHPGQPLSTTHAVAAQLTAKLQYMFHEVNSTPKFLTGT